MGKAKYCWENDGRLPLQIKCTHLEKIDNSHQNAGVSHNGVAHDKIVDSIVNDKTNEQPDANKDSPFDDIEINNESKLQTAEEFEGR